MLPKEVHKRLDTSWNATGEETATNFQDSPEACVQNYFHALYEGDIDALRRAFHPRARLTGMIQGEPYERALGDYLMAAGDRVSPKMRGETYAMARRCHRPVGDIASVRGCVPVTEG